MQGNRKKQIKRYMCNAVFSVIVVPTGFIHYIAIQVKLKCSKLFI